MITRPIAKQLLEEYFKNKKTSKEIAEKYPDLDPDQIIMVLKGQAHKDLYNSAFTRFIKAKKTNIPELRAEQKQKPIHAREMEIDKPPAPKSTPPVSSPPVQKKQSEPIVVESPEETPKAVEPPKEKKQKTFKKITQKTKKTTTSNAPKDEWDWPPPNYKPPQEEGDMSEEAEEKSTEVKNSVTKEHKKTNDMVDNLSKNIKSTDKTLKKVDTKLERNNKIGREAKKINNSLNKTLISLKKQTKESDKTVRQNVKKLVKANEGSRKRDIDNQKANTQQLNLLKKINDKINFANKELRKLGKQAGTYSEKTSTESDGNDIKVVKERHKKLLEKKKNNKDTKNIISLLKDIEENTSDKNIAGIFGAVLGTALSMLSKENLEQAANDVVGGLKVAAGIGAGVLAGAGAWKARKSIANAAKATGKGIRGAATTVRNTEVPQQRNAQGRFRKTNILDKSKAAAANQTKIARDKAADALKNKKGAMAKSAGKGLANFAKTGGKFALKAMVGMPVARLLANPYVLAGAAVAGGAYYVYNHTKTGDNIKNWINGNNKQTTSGLSPTADQKLEIKKSNQLEKLSMSNNQTQTNNNTIPMMSQPAPNITVTPPSVSAVAVLPRTPLPNDNTIMNMERYNRIPKIIVT